jgi:hypothetical protein
LKLNPFDDYTLIESPFDQSRFKAYYRPSNTLVEIERVQVLRISQTFARIKCLIIALQKKYM